MKTLRNITFALIALFAVSSCTDEYYTQEYYNEVYEETWYVEEFEIRGSDWTLVGKPDEIDSHYEYIFDKIPLDVSYYDGIVTAYIYFDYDTKDEVQTPLPYTEYHVDTSTGQEINYSIQYSYDVKADGTIAFKIYVSDYYIGLFKPATEFFRVAIIW